MLDLEKELLSGVKTGASPLAGTTSDNFTEALETKLGVARGRTEAAETWDKNLVFHQYLTKLLHEGLLAEVSAGFFK